MKRDRIFLIVMSLLILAGCSRPLEKRVDSFVSKTEARYENYSEEDWQKSLEEYEALVQEYKDNYKSFSKEEREHINNALGRYSGILLKRGISTAGDALQNLIDGASSFVKGLLDSVDSEE